MEFTIYRTSDAPADARPTLERIQKKYGFIPNLMGILAESPAALDAYVSTASAFDRADLSPVERQVVLLAVSLENGCPYCVAVYSMAARMAGAPDEVLDALRQGVSLPDPRLEALRRFTQAVVGKRGWVGGRRGRGVRPQRVRETARPGRADGRRAEDAEQLHQSPGRNPDHDVFRPFARASPPPRPPRSGRAAPREERQGAESALDSGARSKVDTCAMTGDTPDCCCPPPGAHVEALHCPPCRTRGMRVPLDTVKALLRDTAMRRLTPSEHAFCPDPGCPVVYFTADGDVYLTTDMRVAVWQKEPFGARTVCYCFGENEADMRNEIERTGTSEAVARVRAHIKAQRCACEARNPRGACCLGDVTEAARRVAAAAAVER